MKLSELNNFLFVRFILLAGIITVIIVFAIHDNKMEQQINEPQTKNTLAAAKIIKEAEKYPGTPNIISIEESIEESIEYMIPKEASAFKTYMDYRSITNQSSEQWKLQQLAETDDQGFRIYDHRYMVAVGSYYSNYIGKKFKITLDTGKIKKLIVGDVKADKDVINGQYHLNNGNLVEFIIDKEIMDPNVLRSGDISSLGFEGKIIKIEEE